MDDIMDDATATGEPKVSVGLPVFNGEKYVDESIESILNQTYRDLELVISDNCSTDRTEEICRKWEALDDRVHYFRNDENQGGAWNHNRVFREARGEYFHWASHDDRLMPEFIAECVATLDAHPEVVLSYTKVLQIDGHGDPLEPWSDYSDVTSNDRVERMRAALRDWMCLPIYGLIRSDVLRRTGLLRPYHAADRLLLGELAIYGKWSLSEKGLFVHRQHPGMSGIAYKGSYRRGAWWDPNSSRAKNWPNWLYHLGVGRMILASPLNLRDKARGIIDLSKLMFQARKQLAFDPYRIVHNRLFKADKH